MGQSQKTEQNGPAPRRPVDETRLKQLHQAGATYKAIGAALGVSASRAWAMAKEMGLPRRGQGKRPPRKAA